MKSTIFLLEEYFPGDPMVPALAAFVELGGDNFGRVISLAQHYWFFRFKAPHPKLKAHERNPVWVRLTHERCKKWGCPVPIWANDYTTCGTRRLTGYRWPTAADERRAAAFLEAIEKSAIPDESRTHDTPWGERPRLTQQERQQVKALMADKHGDSTSEETSMRLLGAAERHWVEWMNFVWEASSRAKGKLAQK
jgi:hypothetical protein